MSYQSPIGLIMSDMQVKMEGEILKAVQNIGVNVDKEELLKALKYDRNQYQKGYADRDSEIVRCKDCKWAWNINPTEEEKFYVCKNPTMVNMRYSHQGDWFCADGEKEGR